LLSINKNTVWIKVIFFFAALLAPNNSFTVKKVRRTTNELKTKKDTMK